MGTPWKSSRPVPVMQAPPLITAALSYYRPGTPGLESMEFRARGETVSLLDFDQETGLVGVPRTLAPIGVQDRRAVGGFTFDDRFTGTFRHGQEAFVDGIVSALENEGGCIGEAQTGMGKTVSGCAVICRIGRPVCVVIPKSDLDWTGELVKHTTIRPEEIDVWQGQRLPDPKAKVVIAMLQSVYRDGVYPGEVYERFACVIFDEIHRLGAPEFGRAIRKFPAMWRLGFSATPERRDGMMTMVHAHIGWRHVVAASETVAPDYFLIESTWRPPVFGGRFHDFDPARTGAAKRSLMADSLRNAAISAAAYRAHKAGRRAILFVEQVKHGDRLEHALRAAGVPPASIVRYDGGVSPEDKARAKECPRGIILIATYKFAAEGTNFPALDTCILAHPIYDARQAVGRIVRKAEGFTKPTPVVIDVKDGASPALSRIHAARWEGLRKTGANWRGVFR